MEPGNNGRVMETGELEDQAGLQFLRDFMSSMMGESNAMELEEDNDLVLHMLQDESGTINVVNPNRGEDGGNGTIMSVVEKTEDIVAVRESEWQMFVKKGNEKIFSPYLAEAKPMNGSNEIEIDTDEEESTHENGDEDDGVLHAVHVREKPQEARKAMWMEPENKVKERQEREKEELQKNDDVAAEIDAFYRDLVDKDLEEGQRNLEKRAQESKQYSDQMSTRDLDGSMHRPFSSVVGNVHEPFSSIAEDIDTDGNEETAGEEYEEETIMGEQGTSGLDQLIPGKHKQGGFVRESNRVSNVKDAVAHLNTAIFQKIKTYNEIKNKEKESMKEMLMHLDRQEHVAKEMYAARRSFLETQLNELDRGESKEIVMRSIDDIDREEKDRVLEYEFKKMNIQKEYILRQERMRDELDLELYELTIQLPDMEKSDEIVQLEKSLEQGLKQIQEDYKSKFMDKKRTQTFADQVFEVNRKCRELKMQLKNLEKKMKQHPDEEQVHLAEKLTQKINDLKVSESNMRSENKSKYKKYLNKLNNFRDHYYRKIRNIWMQKYNPNRRMQSPNQPTRKCTNMGQKGRTRSPGPSAGKGKSTRGELNPARNLIRSTETTMEEVEKWSGADSQRQMESEGGDQRYTPEEPINILEPPDAKRVPVSIHQAIAKFVEEKNELKLNNESKRKEYVSQVCEAKEMYSAKMDSLVTQLDHLQEGEEAHENILKAIADLEFKEKKRSIRSEIQNEELVHNHRKALSKSSSTLYTKFKNLTKDLSDHEKPKAIIEAEKEFEEGMRLIHEELNQTHPKNQDMNSRKQGHSRSKRYNTLFTRLKNTYRGKIHKIWMQIYNSQEAIEIPEPNFGAMASTSARCEDKEITIREETLVKHGQQNKAQPSLPRKEARKPKQRNSEKAANQNKKEKNHTTQKKQAARKSATIKSKTDVENPIYSDIAEFAKKIMDGNKKNRKDSDQQVGTASSKGQVGLPSEQLNLRNRKRKVVAMMQEETRQKKQEVVKISKRTDSNYPGFDLKYLGDDHKKKLAKDRQHKYRNAEQELQQEQRRASESIWGKEAEKKKETARKETERKDNTSKGNEPSRKRNAQDERSDNWKAVTAEYESKYC